MLCLFQSWKYFLTLIFPLTYRIIFKLDLQGNLILGNIEQLLAKQPDARSYCVNLDKIYARRNDSL
jgi:hypothetical protein